MLQHVQEYIRRVQMSNIPSENQEYNDLLMSLQKNYPDDAILNSLIQNDLG